MPRTAARNPSIAGVQPGRLAALGDLQSDGLLQRLLPVIVADTKMGEDIPDNGVLAAYDELIASLLKLAGCPQSMSPAAAVRGRRRTADLPA